MRWPPLPGALQALFEEPLPNRVSWAHVLGSALLGLLALMAVTGVLLALGYAPSTASAWESVTAIEQDPWGRLVRGLHHWGASVVIVLAAAHLARVYLFAAYRPPRHWTWVAGVGLLLVLLGFGLTGYLLPWDMKAYFGTRVATAIPASLPVIGPVIGQLIRGAGDVGDFTLTRFYTAHVILLPAALVGLVLLHLRLVRRHGITPPFADQSDVVRRDRPFFPWHAWKDSLAVLVAVGGVTYLAVAHGAPLGDKADPSNSTYVPRPEWYFLGLQHLLRIFTGPWQILATAILPGAAVTALLLVPWLDRNRRHRPAHRPVALGLGTLSAAVVVGLTVAGYRAVEHEERQQAMRAATPTSARAVTQPEPDIDLARQGAQLYADLQCAACHGTDRKTSAPGLPPDLSAAGSRLRQAWTASYLLQPTPIRWQRQDQRPVIRMPDYALSEEEAAALAAHLATRQGHMTPEVDDDLLVAATATEGRLLFEQYACSGCHVIEGRGQRVGPDLSRVGDRLQREYVFAFLQNPGEFIPGTPMEQVDLWPEEAAALAAFLATLR